MEEELIAQLDPAAAADWTDKVWERLTDIVVNKGPEMVVAFIIACVGYGICRWIRKVAFRILSHSKIEPSAVSFIADLVYFFCMAIVVGIVLGTLGLSTTSISAALGGIGLGIGLALKDKISNVASGIYVLIFEPFHVGDYIETGAVSGTVASIRIMYTEIRTTGNQMIIVPNLTMTSSIITNYSFLATRNVEFDIGVGYDTDLPACVALMRRIIAESPYVVDKENFPVYVKNFGDSSITIYARAEVKREDYYTAMNALYIDIKKALDQSGIDIPFPQIVVHQAK